MIRVILPPQLRQFAHIEGEVHLELSNTNTSTITTRAMLDALEAQYPTLHGTLRDPITKLRRAKVRFFVCGQDRSHEPLDSALPQAVLDGTEAFLIVAAISGG